MAQTARLNPEQTPQDTDDNALTALLRLRPPLTFTPAPPTWRVILYIGTEAGSAVALDVREQVMIGRADLVDGYVPGLDLTDYGARDAGVSRRHAALFITDGQLYLRDLGSINGTRINAVRLELNRPCNVQAGDRIEFGNLQVVVQRIEPPA